MSNNHCIFCHCLPVKWSNLASQYAQSYKLCEMHMETTHRMALGSFYTPEQRDKISMRTEMFRPIKEAFDKLNEYDPARNLSDEEQDAESYIMDRIYAPLYDFEPDEDFTPTYTLTDSDVDNAIAHKIKSLAIRAHEGKSVHRCVAHAPGRPDSTCENYGVGDACLCNTHSKAAGKLSQAKAIDVVAINVLELIKAQMKELT